jgi:hypothetical protein
MASSNYVCKPKDKIDTVDLILRRLDSYEGVNGTEMFITTKLVYYQDWLKREIDKRLKSEEEEEEQWQQQPATTTISNTVKRYDS